MRPTSRGADVALGAGGHRGATTRPWHVPGPWPAVTPSEPPTREQVAELVTASQERHTRRMHGAR